MINHILEWIMTLGEIIVYLNEWSRFEDKLSLLWNFVYYEFWKSAPFKGPCGTFFQLCVACDDLYSFVFTQTQTQEMTFCTQRSTSWWLRGQSFGTDHLSDSDIQKFFLWRCFTWEKLLWVWFVFHRPFVSKVQLRLVLHCHLHHSNGKYKL